MSRRILVTGSEGYLMSMLLTRLAERDDVESIAGVDIKPDGQEGGKFTYHRVSVTNLDALNSVFELEQPDTVIHAAWTFNPVHDMQRQREVDIGGSYNVLELCRTTKSVRHIVYTGSTTAYAPIPENTAPADPSQAVFLKEEQWAEHAEKRKAVDYGYSANKAAVDEIFQNFSKDNPGINVFWFRGPIVVGPHMENIISYIIRSPVTFGLFMFQVAGYDPVMQLLSEEDTVEILYRAVTERWTGVANVASEGAIRYSKLIELSGKRKITLPASILRPLCETLWKLRILKFPGALIEMIRYPWVGDTTKMKEHYGYIPKHTAEDAARHYMEFLLEEQNKQGG